MKRQSKWWLLLLFPLILFSLLWAALYFTSFDAATKIAHMLLFQANSNINERAFTAAINARFPKGAKPGELTEFVNAVSGHCLSAEKGRFSCSINESGAFCVTTKIGLDVRLNANGTIETISAKEYFIGC